MQRPFLLEVRASGGGRSVVTREPIPRGTLIAPLPVERLLHRRARYTLQLDENLHGEGLGPFTWLNHSCDPNVFVDTHAREVASLVEIEAGTELTFFYPSTEWELAEPFDCACGSAHCLGRVMGASLLPREILRRHRLNAYIEKRLG